MLSVKKIRMTTADLYLSYFPSVHIVRQTESMIFIKQKAKTEVDYCFENLFLPIVLTLRDELSSKNMCNHSILNIIILRCLSNMFIIETDYFL